MTTDALGEFRGRIARRNMTWEFDDVDQALRYLRSGVRAVLLIGGLVVAAFFVYVLGRASWEIVVLLEKHVW